jgi:hypothetical protein
MFDRGTTVGELLRSPVPRPETDAGSNDIDLVK